MEWPRRIRIAAPVPGYGVDLVMAADCVRPEDVNFMARYGRGLICLTLTEERADFLRLFPMTQQKSYCGR